MKPPALVTAARPNAEDIAILTGGKAITEDLGIKLENVKIEDLGHAKKVSIDKDNTTIVAGAGKASEIEGRIKQLRVQVEETMSDYDKEKLQERLAKAGWRRRGDQSGRGNRDRIEREKGSRRGPRDAPVSA